MPIRTIYIKKEDEALLEKAKQLGGKSLSAVIADALKLYIKYIKKVGGKYHSEAA